MLRRSLQAACSASAAATGAIASRPSNARCLLAAAARSTSAYSTPSSSLVSASLATSPSIRTIRTSAILQQAAAAAAAAAESHSPEALGLDSVTEDVEAVETDADPEGSFRSLKSKLSSGVFKALTVKPFAYDRMSEVQRRVLHLIPERGTDATQQKPKDLLVKAKTGTGKTIAFLTPAIETRLRSLRDADKGKWSSAFDRQLREKRPELADSGNIKKIARAFASNTTGTLILSPTRELATQIATEAKKLLSHYPEMGVQLLVGGASKFHQLRDWRSSRADIVVATPGRIRDLLNTEPMIKDAISTAETVILDEADTLLEMGFRDDLRAILQSAPPTTERNTFLFSATVSKEIQSVARQSLNHDHLFIDCVPEGEENTHMHIPQYATVLPSAADQMEHIVRLIAHDQLTNPGKSKIIVFAPTTRMTQLLAAILESRQVRSLLPVGSRTQLYEIHSKKDQSVRFKVSDRFRKDKSGASILVTSDVSARGVDYPGTTRVIQVGVPSSKDQYVHRIGRTGRAGKQGRGDIVLLPFEAGFVHSALEDLPIRTLGVDELKQEVEAKVAAFDEDPSSVIDAATLKAMERTRSQPPRGADRFSRDRRGAKPAPSFDGPQPFVPELRERLNDGNVSQTVRSSVEAVDPEDIRETFATLLGYYVGRGADMRASKPAMLDGLRKWTTEAGGLEQEPHTSQAFLLKLGYGGSDRDSGGRGGSYGGRGGGRGGSRGGYGASRNFKDRYASPYGGDRRGGSRGGDRYGGGRGGGRYEGRDSRRDGDRKPAFAQEKW